MSKGGYYCSGRAYIQETPQSMNFIFDRYCQLYSRYKMRIRIFVQHELYFISLDYIVLTPNLFPVRKFQRA